MRKPLTNCAGVLLLLVGLSFAPASALSGDTVVAWGKYMDSTFGVETFVPMQIPPGLTNVATSAAGFNNLLALKKDGTIAVWGDPNSSVRNGQPWGGGVIGLAAGGNFALALTFDGTVKGWGWSGAGAESPPSGLTNVISIGADFARSTALKADGTLIAWATNLYGPVKVPWGLDNIVALSRNGLLAVRQDGTAVGWDYQGDLSTNLPSNLTNLLAIEDGLALKADSSVIAWGNANGRTNVPTNLSNVLAIAVGTTHALALKRDGTVVAWGLNPNGETNVPAGLTNVTAIAAGWGFSLAQVGDGSPFFVNQLSRKIVADGTPAKLRVLAGGADPLTYVWRFNGAVISGATDNTLTLPDVTVSQAGIYSVTVSNTIGSTTSSNLLQVVPLLITVHPQNLYPLIGSSTTLQMRAYGRAPLNYQWTFNGVNIPGATNSELPLSNVQLNQNGNYSATVSNTSASLQSSNALVSVQQVAVWGSARTNVPYGLTNAVTVAGDRLVLTADGRLLTWGDPLGLFSTLQQGVRAVAVGPDGGHRLWLKTNGVLVADGDNRYGQSDIPAGLTNVVGIGVGRAYSVALRAEGTAVGWDNSYYFQTNLADLRNIVAVSAGNDHVVFLRSDGTVTARGGNLEGETNVPPGLSGVIAIAAGPYHNLALKADGTVVAWGANYSGQTNVPANLDQVVAIAAGGLYSSSSYSLALRRDGTIVTWGSNYQGVTTFLPI